MNLSKLIYESIFSLIELGILLGSLGTISFANAVYSAFSLGLVFTCISLLYFVLNADFVAAAQLLVYVGAINVLIAFAVMVTEKPIQSASNIWGMGYFTTSGACAMLFLALVNAIYDTDWFKISLINESKTFLTNTLRIDVHQLGYTLFSNFLVPFELLSILLLVALVGAINSAQDKDAVTTDEKSPFSASHKDFSSF